MPLYEYQCQACGMRFERQQHVNDEPVKVCPECGGEVHRLIQPVGIIFRGSGFYVTDNRAKSSTSGTGGSKKRSEKPEEKESESADRSSDKDSAKSE
jgi:putative FmdB family regulatory protein